MGTRQGHKQLLLNTEKGHSRGESQAVWDGTDGGAIPGRGQWGRATWTAWCRSLVTGMESSIPGVRNRRSMAAGRRRQAATVVLTGNPGSPGVPSGPCDTTKTKRVVQGKFRTWQERCPSGAHPSQHLPKAEAYSLTVGLTVHFAEEDVCGGPGEDRTVCIVTQLVSGRARNCAQAPRAPVPQSQNCLHCKWPLPPPSMKSLSV